MNTPAQTTIDNMMQKRQDAFAAWISRQDYTQTAKKTTRTAAWRKTEAYREAINAAAFDQLMNQ